MTLHCPACGAVTSVPAVVGVRCAACGWTPRSRRPAAAYACGACGATTLLYDGDPIACAHCGAGAFTASASANASVVAPEPVTETIPEPDWWRLL